MSFIENSGNGMYMPVAPLGGYGYGNNGGFGFGDGAGAWVLLFIIAAMFGGFGNGWGNGGFDGGAFPWLLNSNQQLSTQIQQGFDQNNTNNQLSDLRSDIITGFSNAEVSNCNRAMNQMQSAYENEIQSLQATFGLQKSMDNCCCENRLATAETQALISREAAANRENVTNGVQRIMDKLCDQDYQAALRENQELRQENLMKDLAASQAAQTAAFVADNNAQTQYIVNRVAPYPIPSYTVNNPYGCSNGYYPNYFNGGFNNGFGYVGFGNGSF